MFQAVWTAVFNDAEKKQDSALPQSNKLLPFGSHRPIHRLRRTLGFATGNRGKEPLLGIIYTKTELYIIYITLYIYNIIYDIDNIYLYIGCISIYSILPFTGLVWATSQTVFPKMENWCTPLIRWHGIWIERIPLEEISAMKVGNHSRCHLCSDRILSKASVWGS